jgi:acetyltransferase-like isoleucine patch superfamily enzyme
MPMSRLSKFLRRKTTIDRHQTKSALAKNSHSIGDFSYGVPIIRSWGEGSNLTIGRFCSFADGVQIFLGGNHRMDWVTTYPFIEKFGWPKIDGLGPPGTKGDVVIGNDVWVGSGATIMSGVTLGDGCVVGANAVVAKNVAAYEIVVGNPARLVKTRFDAATIEALLEIRWWDWDEEKVRKFIPLLMSGNLNDFIRLARESQD